ncbi:AMP-binding protein, partial [Streptomyces tendae]|uniref:AMP-binding protein n=1 Tax=Streptomyces tendae TaxID=1932 RepID=UPI0036C21C1B
SLAAAQTASAVPAPAPLFTTLLNYRHNNLDDGSFLFEGVNFLGGQERTNYALTVSVDDFGDGFGFAVQAAAPIDPSQVIEILHTTTESVVTALGNEPERIFGSVPVMRPADVDRVVREWNATDRVVPEATIPGLFAEQVRLRPDAVAVVHGDVSVTYAQLDAASNRLARYLQERGVGPESVVAVNRERSIDLVVSLLAVLKAGGTYLPIEPTQPDQRIRRIIADAGVNLVLSAEIVDDPAVSAFSDSPLPDMNIQASQAAYVIYTSGSTGVPKGVVVTHASVVSLVLSAGRRFAFSPSDVWSWFHSFAFDVSVWEIWGALVHGTRLVVVDFEVSRSPAEFRQLLGRERVTVVSLTPSAFYQLLQADAGADDRLENLRYVFLAGETLDLAQARQWYDRPQSALLVNMYGITEITVHATAAELDAVLVEQRAGVIGVPLDNTRVYVLDGNM